MAATTEIEVTMLFTRSGVPATDINTTTPGYPRVRIWNITDGTNSLVVDNALMTSVTDGADNDGFYKYVFNLGAGFDETQKYVCLFDAGASIPDYERYNNGTIVPDLGNEILDKISDISDPDSIASKLDEILAITTYLRKFESNRTQVDVNTGDLIVYDDDCTTIMWKFRLFDENGLPNVESVAQRIPAVGGTAPWNTCTKPS